MTIKMHLGRWLVAFFLLNAGFVFADGFKSKIITSSPLTITVPGDRSLKITNFTQEGGTERGVVSVNLSGDAGGNANVLTATRIDLSTGINSQTFPEINNRVVIAGPAEVRISPVPGATLLITYKKEPNEGGEETTLPHLPLILVPPVRYAKSYANRDSYAESFSEYFSYNRPLAREPASAAEPQRQLAPIFYRRSIWRRHPARWRTVVENRDLKLLRSPKREC